MINNLRKEIDEYAPFNEQERLDKEVMLESFDIFDDVLTRNNWFTHFSASAIVVNENLNKTIICYHNNLKGYAYPGGHADGEEDLLSVAIREVKEELNLDATPLLDGIFSIQILPYHGHMRKGVYVPAHTHMDVLYLLQCKYEDMNKIRIEERELGDAKLININQIDRYPILPYMKPTFDKGVEKIKRLKKGIY